MNGHTAKSDSGYLASKLLSTLRRSQQFPERTWIQRSDELFVDPDDLMARADALETGVTIASDEFARFSRQAPESRSGFPGRTARKFEDLLEYWEAENRHLAGIVDDLAARVRSAANEFITADQETATAINLAAQPDDTTNEPPPRINL